MAHKGIIREIYEHSWAFALTFLFLFGITFGFLALVGATPDPLATTPGTTTNEPTPQPNTPEKPVRVVAQKINLDATIVNPSSTDVAALDQELTRGAVRYPTSALLGEKGTVLLFGHSSYLPIVYHQYYKTFNGIQNLKTGDIISVYSDTKEYRYSVTGVRVADASDADESIIELPNDAPHLTLVTCDSFATKSNRFVVTADFVEAHPTSN